MWRLALVAVLAASTPAFAQGKGGEKGKHDDRGKPAKVQQSKNDSRGKPANAQAKRNEERGQPDKAQADKGQRGNSDKAKEDRGNSRGNSGRFERSFEISDVKAKLRKVATSSRAPERIAAGALSRGHARGLGDDDVRIRQNGDRVSLFNRAGVLLIDLDEQRARNLGNWRVHPYDDDVKAGAPAFCRSGEGHPVFGRDEG